MKHLRKLLSNSPFVLFLILSWMIGVAWAADSKLSALTNLGAAPAATDELYLNDAGVSKALTVDNLFNYTPSDFTLTDGTDPHIIKAVQETGLGGRLTIGLDETARTLVIADYGDIDTDLGLSAESQPSLKIYDADADSYVGFIWGGDDNPQLYSTANLAFGTNVYLASDRWMGFGGTDYSFKWDQTFSTTDDVMLFYSGESNGGTGTDDIIPIINIGDATMAALTTETSNIDATEPGIRLWNDTADSWSLWGANDDNPQITIGGNATDFRFGDGTVTGLSVFRETRSQAFTAGETQTTVTAAHMLGAKYITDQGGSAETDLILTAVSYYIDCILVDTEGNGFEICPPSGEAIYLDGTAIAADDCVDSTGAVGARASLSRAQIADGSYAYFITTLVGTWADGNDTGD